MNNFSGKVFIPSYLSVGDAQFIHSYCVEMHFEGNFYPNDVVECGVWAMTRHQWLDNLLGRMITHENSYKLPLIDKLVSVS